MEFQHLTRLIHCQSRPSAHLSKSDPQPDYPIHFYRLGKLDPAVTFTIDNNPTELIYSIIRDLCILLFSL